MPWPAPSDYEFSVQNPRVSFEDPDLRECAVVTTPLGLPRVASGNFASVYELRRGQDDRYAVRCFLREVTDQHRRYTLITNHLAGFSLPYVVGFNYVGKGILVGGQWYPIVRMDWVEGRPLHAAVEERLDYPGTLLELAKQWRGLIAALRGLHMAHGDLQHGNILVTPEDDLRLVDYDGMFVPRMRGEKAPELGHPSYQHPRRSAEGFDANLDYFSALVIFLGIRALATDRGLWEFHNGDNLILKRTDFEAPGNSPAFARLLASKDPAVKRLAEDLAGFCKAEQAQTQSLEAVLVRVPSNLLFPKDVLRKTRPRSRPAPPAQPKLAVDPRIDLHEVRLGAVVRVGLPVRNLGEGVLALQVAGRDPWVQPEHTAVRVRSQAPVHFRIDTRGLSVGHRTVVVDLKSNGGDASVTFEMDVVQAKTTPVPAGGPRRPPPPVPVDESGSSVEVKPIGDMPVWLADFVERVRATPAWAWCLFPMLGLLALALLTWPFFWAFLALTVLALPWLFLRAGWGPTVLAQGCVLALFVLLSHLVGVIPDGHPVPVTELPHGYVFPSLPSPPGIPRPGAWVRPKEVRASSVQGPDEELKRAADGDLRTAWVSKEQDPTKPACIELKFDTPQELDAVAILNGWTVTEGPASSGGETWVLHPRIRQARLVFDEGKAYDPPELPQSREFWQLIAFVPRKASRVRLKVLSTTYQYNGQLAPHDVVLNEIWCRLHNPAREPDPPASPHATSIAGNWLWHNGTPVVFGKDGRVRDTGLTAIEVAAWGQDGVECPLYYKDAARPVFEPMGKVPPPPPAPPTTTERWESPSGTFFIEFTFRGTAIVGGSMKTQNYSGAITGGRHPDGPHYARFSWGLGAEATADRQSDGSLLVRALGVDVVSPIQYWPPGHRTDLKGESKEPPPPGTVIKIEGGVITVSWGSRHGVSVGMIVTILLRTRPILHQGVQIGYEVTEMRVDRVEDTSCHGTLVDPQDELPRPGDPACSKRQP